MQNCLVCCDRDGTINIDLNNYLGSQKDWKEKIDFLPGVIEGLKRLNEKNIPTYIITNQAGVALKGFDKDKNLDFDLLDEKRAREVNEFIIEKAFKMGARIRGYQICPFVNSEYVKKSEQRGRKVHKNYVKDNSPDLKPNAGMVRKCVALEGFSNYDCKIFVIGDRPSDIRTGLNANAELSVLVIGDKTKEINGIKEVEELIRQNPGKITICERFDSAVDEILKRAN